MAASPEEPHQAGGVLCDRVIKVEAINDGDFKYYVLMKHTW